MKVVKHTGLVPIKITGVVSGGVYMKGRTYGLPPTQALKVLEAGSGVEAPVPEGVAYTEVPGPGRAAGTKSIPKAPPAETGNAAGMTSKGDPSLKLPGQTGAGFDASGVAIPEGWQDNHFLANIALAKKIANDQNAKIDKSEAERIIREELDRRAAL